ncbi:response regulator transcription factor [Ruminiclostridium cellobioparum]|uniref:response regulator transcription factor n=1 Tax=Ruminiclostridium cellobioparum TaxID=29355 RepID=UPI0028AC376B|nr:response regulator [Ruminiclostridium cellobioparum]
MRNLKVTFVDDESIVISDLLTLIDWENSGFIVEGWAYSPDNTLRLVKQCSPDIVFMDVSLPGMDGIELCKKIKEIVPFVTFIILSGYMNFSYAQRAIDVGIFTYLVKHEMTSEKLLDVMEKVRAKIEKQENENTLIRTHALKNYLQRHLTIAQLSILEQAHLSPYRKQFTLIMLTALVPFLLRGRKEHSLFSSYTGSPVELSIPENHTTNIFEQNGDLVVITNCIQNVTSGKDYLFCVRQLINTIQNDLLQKFGMNFFAVYLPRASKLETLHHDFELLHKCLPLYIFHKIPAMQISGQIKHSIAAELDISFINRDGFLNSYQEMVDKTSDVLDRARKMEDFGLFSKCVNQILLLLSGFGMDIIKNKTEISQLLDVESVSEYLLLQLSELYRSNTLKSGLSASTCFVINYIKKNYNSWLSLSEASALLNSNSMYIGRKFKSETGKAFHEYLADYRILQAKELLCSTNMKIRDIAQQIGISNSQYLSKTFKKITGKTPYEYRNQHSYK